MPLDLSDPTFRGLLAAVRGGGPCPNRAAHVPGTVGEVWHATRDEDVRSGYTPVPCPACEGSGRAKPDPAAARVLGLDWLPEQGAEAGDVLRLYAAPPATDGALCRADFTAGVWEHAPAEDDSLGPVLAAWAEGHAPAGRAEAVREWGEITRWLGDVPGARPEGKRRVLGLWDGEVVFNVECAVSEAAIRAARDHDPNALVNDTMARAGFLAWVPVHRQEDDKRRLRLYRQRYRPSDLIPPDPSR